MVAESQKCSTFLSTRNLKLEVQLGARNLAHKYDNPYIFNLNYVPEISISTVHHFYHSHISSIPIEPIEVEIYSIIFLLKKKKKYT